MNALPVPYEALYETDQPRPEVPLLATGLAAALVGGADGELGLVWEARGAPMQWGGVYAQGIRLTGSWKIGGTVDGVPFSLEHTLQHLAARRPSITSRHRWGPIAVRQELLPFPRAPGAVRRLTLESDVPAKVVLRSSIAPFLAPVMVEGIKPYEYHLRALPSGREVTAHGHGMAIASRPEPTLWTLDGVPWGSEDRSGEVGSIETTHTLQVPPGVPSVVSWVVWGGLERTLRDSPRLGALVLDGGPEGRSEEADRLWAAWTDATPELCLPDDPALERAYRLARGALRALYTQPEPGLQGLVAGYPWYAAIWCRDLAWMLPAVLWLGDFDWARGSLDAVFRFQANARIPILGAEPGELPMQVSPGPVFLFGTSDTSLHYPALAAGFLRHSGRTAPVAAWWPHLVSVSEWIAQRTSAESGLFRNGGEAEEIQSATAELGSVHYGFDAVDTTIWDSTDRRDHAIDVQVLARRALRAMVELATRVPGAGPGNGWAERAERVDTALAGRYGWTEEQYLFDSLHLDASPVRKLRPNALRAVSEGLIPLEAARRIVERGAAPDLTTPWGLRTLSERDPSYDPIAYHDGQVWSIATAWAADAAYAVGDAGRGYDYLSVCADRVVTEHGLANECYRGDAPVPFDSCFLLGFSIAPFLSLLFERLWGLEVDAVRHRLAVRPQFPRNYRSATLHRLSLGTGRVDLDWAPGRLRVAWNGDGPLTVSFDDGAATVEPGVPAEIDSGRRQS